MKPAWLLDWLRLGTASSVPVLANSASTVRNTATSPQGVVQILSEEWCLPGVSTASAIEIAAPSWMSPAASRDEYGFQLNCDVEQTAARERCAQSSSKQALKWAKYAQKQSLPTGDKLKKLCRKVGLALHAQRDDLTHGRAFSKSLPTN